MKSLQGWTRRAMEMRAVLEELDEGGWSVRELAEERGLTSSTIWYWRRRLREIGQDADLSDSSPSDFAAGDDCVGQPRCDLRACVVGQQDDSRAPWIRVR